MEETEEYLPVPKQLSTGLPFYSNVDISLGTGEVILSPTPSKLLWAIEMAAYEPILLPFEW